MTPEQIAQRIVDQWEKHDRFRQIAEETGLFGMEPQNVTLAKAYLHLIETIKSAHECEWILEQ